MLKLRLYWGNALQTRPGQVAENPERSSVRGLRPPKILDTWKYCVLESTGVDLLREALEFVLAEAFKNSTTNSC